MTQRYLLFFWLFAAYFLTGCWGLSMPAVGTQISLIWLPSGISVGCFYRWGCRFWPSVFVAASALNFVFGSPLSTALAIAAGNTAAPLLVVWLLRRTDFRPSLRRWQDIGLLAAAAHVGMLISASNGILSITYIGNTIENSHNAWWCWWIGDSIGVIIAAPLVLVASKAELRGIRARWTEFVAWLCLTVTLAWAVFILNDNVGEPALALAFVPLPLIAWATHRFQATGTSLAIILLSSIAAWGTAHQTGMFYRTQPTEQMILIAGYMATSIILGWLISSLHFSQLQAVNIQRLLEEALREASMGVLLANNAQRITYANAGFTRLTGHTQEEMLGQKLGRLESEPASATTQMNLRFDLDATGHFDGEVLSNRKDGTTFWNSILVMPLFSSFGEQTGFLGLQRDVTARKEADIAVRRSEARLQTILNLEPECVKIVASDGRLLEMNPAGLAMVDAAAMTQVRGLFVADIVAKDHREIFLRMHEQVLAGASVSYEFAAFTLSGRELWLESHAVPYRDDEGRIVGQLAVTRDMTARKRTDHALQESRNRLDSILNSIRDVIYSSSPAGDEIYFISNFAETLYGYPTQEFIKNPQKWFDVVHPEDRDHINYALTQLKTTGQFNLEYRIIRADGMTRWVRDSGRIITDAAGRRIRLDGVVSDITERKIAEDELRASDARYRQLFLSNPHPMWVYDMETLAFLAVNDAAVSHYGYTREEFLAMTIREIRPPEDIPSLLRSVGQVPEGIDKAGILRHQLRSGELIDVEITSHTLRFNDRPSGLVLAFDVTEKNRSEEHAARELVILEMMAHTAPRRQILERIVLITEQMFPGMKCSLLLMDPDGIHLRHEAAPSLPPEFCRAIDGSAIGPMAGSCGTAAFTKSSVYVSDIAVDDRWNAYREIALPFGLRACWSVPMISSQGTVLGTLAMYYCEPRTPTAAEVRTIERAAHLVVLAIERDELVCSLRESRIQLETLISNLPGMAYRCQNDSRWTMTFVSSGCELVTGYRRDELENNASLSYAELIHTEDRDGLWEKRQMALATRIPCSNIYRITDKSGGSRWVQERASGVYDTDGTLRCIDGFIEDITESRHIEAQLRASLREKVVLLKEIHHRVKNNLQIIASLLNLQADQVQDPITLAALRESQNRVRSMSLVHETLYQTEDLGRIDLTEYLNALSRHLFRSYGVDPLRIRMNIRVEHLSLELDQAMPFGLIVNELISNSLKYAFPSNRAGQICIKLQSTREQPYTFVISDDGIGLPDSLDLKVLQTLGLQLVQDLVQQLSGTLTVVRSPFLEFTISFPMEATLQEAMA